MFSKPKSEFEFKSMPYDNKMDPGLIWKSRNKNEAPTALENQEEEQRSRSGIFRNHHEDGTYTDEISFILEVYNFEELKNKYGKNGNRFYSITENAENGSAKKIICTAHLVNDCSSQWNEDKNIIRYQGSRPLHPCTPRR